MAFSTYDDWKLRAPEDDSESTPDEYEGDDGVCEECLCEAHDACSDIGPAGYCECPCRDGYERTRHGWHKPLRKVNT